MTEEEIIRSKEMSDLYHEVAETREIWIKLYKENPKSPETRAADQRHTEAVERYVAFMRLSPYYRESPK